FGELVLTTLQRFARWYASGYWVLPINVPWSIHVLVVKTGDWVMRATIETESPQAEFCGESVTPYEVKVNVTGMISTGTVVVPESGILGSVPTIVKGMP